MAKAVAVDLDGALGDTRPLWRAFVDDAARRFAPIARLDAASLPEDRSVASRELDRWAQAGVGDWRKALERFAEEHAPVYLRPSPGANTALRALAAAGYRIGLFTDAPEPLARVALAHLGVARHVEVLEAGTDARERLLERLGPETRVALTAEELASAAAARG
jgi:phosphoglycolate phosphatase-like HAD superfamily hydrolase